MCQCQVPCLVSYMTFLAMHPIRSFDANSMRCYNLSVLMVLDFWKPAYYALEKYVASRSIPSIKHRQKPNYYKDDSDRKNGMDHSLWTEVLQSHVSSDRINDITNVNVVDYEGIAKDPKFKEYLQLLADCDTSEWSDSAQISLWINAYNALCIDLIVQKQPKISINELSTSATAVWDLPAGTVAGQKVSLNEIEHVKLRTWEEPRIHACIVCASASCPNLRAEAFESNTLETQMQDQVQDWLNNPTKGLLLHGGHLTLSRIFLWFREDFVDSQKWVGSQVQTQRDAVTNAKTLRYFTYDWTLNRK